MNSTCKQYFMVLIVLCFTLASAASSFNYSGFVTGGAGAGIVLTPPGELAVLLFNADVLQSGDLVNPSDITFLEFYIGDICFSALGVGACSIGGVQVPLINVQTDLMLYTPFSNDPFDGALSFEGFSPTFHNSLIINIDFSALLFTFDFSPIGFTSGCLNEVTPESEPCYTPVPLPGAVLFLGSALMMLGAIRRQA